MTKHNPENERIKRRYFAYLKEAKRRGEPSVDAAAKALNRFELDTRFRSFRTFHPEQAVAFKRHLAEQTNARTGKPLAKATIHSTLAALKAFFTWLAGQPRFRSKLSYSDADYFNLSDRDSRIARTRLDKPAPSLDQVRHAILTMPAGSAIERRDRAVVAFILLTGARDGAVRSIRVKHVDLAAGCLIQDAREVATKNGKTIPATFFPVGADIRGVVEDWIEYLTTQLHWGPDDPLFPATRVEAGPDQTFRPVGLDHRHWTTAEPIRDIFRRAFDSAGLPYYPPHRLRKTLVLLGEVLCQTPEQFKAWSQNLGHSDVLTTFTSYGELTAARQADVIRELGRPKKTKDEALSMLQEATSALLRG
jgi:integrase